MHAHTGNDITNTCWNLHFLISIVSLYYTAITKGCICLNVQLMVEKKGPALMLLVLQEVYTHIHVMKCTMEDVESETTAIGRSQQLSRVLQGVTVALGTFILFNFNQGVVGPDMH